MNESIIVGVVLGGGVALITGYISHWFRLREMKIQSAQERERLEALWAEVERRRKSDRRRDLYDRELKVVRDAVEAVLDNIGTTDRLTGLEESERLKWHSNQVQVVNMLKRAGLVAASLRDEVLFDRCQELIEVFRDWLSLIDWTSGKAIEGKEQEFQKREGDTEWVGGEVWRRIRELLEEV